MAMEEKWAKKKKKKIDSIVVHLAYAVACA